jgi:hypothetical protein
MADESQEVAQAERYPALRREVAQPPSQSGVPTHREVAQPPSQSGARHPDCLPDLLPDVPKDNTLARVVDLVDLVDSLAEQKGASQGAPPSGLANVPEPTPAVAVRVEPVARARQAPPVDPQAAVAAWSRAFAGKSIERLLPQHAPEVAGLLDRLDPPTDGRDRRSVLAERRRVAGQLIERCQSPTRLAEKLTDAYQKLGAVGLCARLAATIETEGAP